MSLNQEKKYKLIFEELHIRHLNLLLDLKDNSANNWFYKMAIINTFEDLKIFLSALEKNKNKCVIAIQNKKIIGYVNIFPINEKKTCLKIDTPVVITDDLQISYRELLLSLIKKSIKNTSIKTYSWVITSDINNQELISCARELGFQPLQEIILWKGRKLNNENFKEIENNNVNYNQINKFNIKKVLNFVRSNESILIRNIIDLEEKDINKRNDKFCKVIYHNNEILFVILKDPSYKDKNVYALVGGICWDERINFVLKYLLEDLIKLYPNIIFKTYEKDNGLNEFLKGQNLIKGDQEITLIKNSMVKREAKSGIKLNKSFESILDKINPQNNPYPSPLPTKLY